MKILSPGPLDDGDVSGLQGERGDLNPQRPDPQSGALPVELRPPKQLLNLIKF